MNDTDALRRGRLSEYHPVAKAIIPAAGLGTRFLPATKVQPKEMLPIIDTPTIQYVVQEVVDSGITDILIVTGKGKRSIEDHFDRSWELEEALAKNGHDDVLRSMREIANMANIHYIRQKEFIGLGNAIYYAKQHVAGEPFAVLLGDTIVDTPAVPATRQLMDFYQVWRCPVLAVEEVPKDKVDRYGVIRGKPIDNETYIIEDLVEKPAPDEAPSNLAIAGRYVFTPSVFDYIEQTPQGKGGEIQITDALRMLCKQERLYAYKFTGKRHDIGNRLDYMKSSVEFALRRADIGAEFREFILALAENLCSVSNSGKSKK
ncbi:MAG: UTP--glucose-1-phosphate uridylyltransferase GalU [bacterium]